MNWVLKRGSIEFGYFPANHGPDDTNEPHLSGSELTMKVTFTRKSPWKILKNPHWISLVFIKSHEFPINPHEITIQTSNGTHDIQVAAGPRRATRARETTRFSGSAESVASATPWVQPAGWCQMYGL